MNSESAPKAKPLPLIHINGFPGTGKLTVARTLQELLRCRLVHNHLLINPADAVLHRTEPGYQDLRRAIRGAVFSSLAHNPATYAFAYVFTDFQSSSAVGSAACAEYLVAARARGCALLSIVLHCDEATNLVRLQMAEREAHGKIVDPELLSTFRREVKIHRFEEPEVTSIDLDVSKLSALEAAERILEHVLEVSPEAADSMLGARVPDK